MSSGNHTLAFVVATKDRAEDLRRMLASLAGQSRRPDEVIIVDASGQPVEHVAAEFPALAIRYVRHLPPSASAQRNAGIKAVGPGIALVGFLDDDAVLEPGAMEAMLRFWEQAPPDLGGAGFNWMNPPPRGRLGAWLKRSRLAHRLGLYSRRQGIVTRSGWQTLATAVPETLYVQWLTSCASVWRKTVLDESRFDEFFDGYSYLEDLDFSYGVSRRHRLAIVADAGFRHYPSPSGRGSAYRFGKIEVRNRLYFVRKHALSVPRCRLGLANRMLITLACAAAGQGVRACLGRAWGNCVGLVRSAFGGARGGPATDETSAAFR